MTVSTKLEGKNVEISVEGRIDTVTAPEFESKISSVITGDENLTLDMANLAYISSAGLRIILSIQKKLTAKGKFIIKNVNDTVYEVFEVTGFADILTIQR